jgi:hypothetical protein
VSDELHPKRIPGAEKATVDDRVTTYLLNEQHEKGKHKAYVFKTLGYSTANAQELESILLTEVAKVEGRYSRENGFGGENWKAIVRLPTNRGTLDLPTFWEVRPGAPPKFLSAHPPKPTKP